ncbi:tripartite motif-containing protein 2-like [Branchiostoma lanceolatum]|uniref:tripartite motif-containing protein 2-like n=1 Tax=Branchiostoma lanceolatum TaxID=7740 RepID=UPI0034570A66
MAAAPSTLGTQIHEKKLSCSICLELFTRPKVLPCQHTFCQDCLQDHAGGKARFLCPNCRRRVRMPRQGVAGFPDSLLVRNLCERLQDQATLSEETKEQPQSGNRCSFHPSEEVKLYCKQCSVPVCNKCLDEIHSDHVTITQKKALEDFASLCERLQNQATLSGETREQPQPGSMCSLHPSEELKLYCKQCQVPLCVDCIEENHDGHPTMSLKKNIQVQRASVQALIDEGRNILESYCTFLHGLREQEKNMKEQKEQTDNSIVQTYNQMVQKFTESKDHLLAEAEQNHRMHIKVVQDSSDAVSADINELSAACDGAEQEMKQVQVNFSTQQTRMTEVVGKYRKKAVPSPVHTQRVVFQPTDTPVEGLGYVRSLLSEAISAAPTAETTMVTFGGEGTQPGKFKDPRGVTVSEEGEIFVADRENKRIQVFTLQGTFINQFPTIVPDGEEMEPWDVALDGEGNLWVVGYIERGPLKKPCIGQHFTHFCFVAQYTKQGRVLRKFGIQKFPEFPIARGIVVDTKLNRIIVNRPSGQLTNQEDADDVGFLRAYRPDGTFLEEMGFFYGEMVYPVYMTMDQEGNILVSDCEKDCVHVYNEQGERVKQFGGGGSDGGQIHQAGGICTDRAGNVIVVDSINGRMAMFDKTGRFLKHIATGLKFPNALAMAPQGQLVVTNCVDHKVTVLGS